MSAVETGGPVTGAACYCGNPLRGSCSPGRSVLTGSTTRISGRKWRCASSPRASTGHASSWSIAISIGMELVGTRCAASSTAKAAGVVSSQRLPALRRPREGSGMSDITTARRALLTRILEGGGSAPLAQRRAAFDNEGLSEPLSTLIDKVARHAYKVTDEDIAAASQSGLTEDQIFEIVACAAIGQATRQYATAVAALEAATGEGKYAPRDPR